MSDRFPSRRSVSRVALTLALGSTAAAVACGGRAAVTLSDAGSQPEAGAALTRCVPGQSVACSGLAGCVGYQICADDGLLYEACLCEPAPPPPVEAGIDAATGYAKRCYAPEGAPISMASTDVPAAIAGQWWNCGGASELQHVEFSADGHYSALTYVDGTFLKNYGADASGTFTIDPGSGIGFKMEVTTTRGDPIGYPLNGVLQTTGRMTLGGG